MKLESGEKTPEELLVCVKVLNKMFSLSCVSVLQGQLYVVFALICSSLTKSYQRKKGKEQRKISHVLAYIWMTKSLHELQSQCDKCT